MNKFLQWFKGEKKKFYLILDNQISELSLNQNIQAYINKLEIERIKQFGLSSIKPEFLESKEEDLLLYRSLIKNTDIKNPFYFRITKYKIVKPIDFRLRLTFYSNNQVKQFENVGATEKEINSVWNHLILNKELSEYNFSKWHNKSEWYKGYLIQREEQERKDLQNPPLMTNVFWDFSGNNFNDKESFINTVKDYNDILEKKWESNKKISAPNELIVYYPYLKDNRQKTGKMTLKSKDPWNNGDLLFAMHKKCALKIQEQDNHFFESLSYLKDDNSGTPTYFLNLGS